jgi:hypothetical protein
MYFSTGHSSSCNGAASLAALIISYRFAAAALLYYWGQQLSFRDIMQLS